MPVTRYLRDALIFAPCYIALDWASYIDPIGLFNITPWNPQPGLAIVWLMLGGLGNIVAVTISIVVSEILVRNAPGGYGVTLMMGLILGGGYALIAWALRKVLQDGVLRTIPQLTSFVAIIFAGTTVLSAAFIGLLQISGMIGDTPFMAAWTRFWTGDAVGILVTAPLLLAAADPQRRSGFAAFARRPEAFLQLIALCGTLWLVFKGLDGDPATHFYLLFLPLIWVAIRSGMNGAIAATAIVQLGAVLIIHDDAVSSLPLIELQALVATLTLTGLFLGMMVDERGRAEENLRHSLRLAAAGEMAGAIAHEINQPLTALINYGRSATILITQDGDAESRLPGILEKMLREAERAADTVKRLRDFFRAGTTKLEKVGIDELFATARRISGQLIGELPVTVHAESPERLPPLLIDRLQIEVVLRNLLSNAVESISMSGENDGRIDISAEAHGPQQICLVVKDSGPGIPEKQRHELFKPFASGKPSGMGMGLTVSQAIVEAHGGTIRVGASGHGEFHVILPCDQKT
ncbi:MAG: sensor histidine kinase [Betaproteobacteria bacterium]